MKVASCLAGVALIVAPIVADAASNAARNRCSDAIRALRRGPSAGYQNEDVPADGVENAIRHLNQIIENWNSAQRQLGQVPKGELDWSDAQLAECKAEVDKWGTYIKETQAKIEAAQGAAKVEGPFFEQVKSHKDAVLTLAGVHFEPLANVLVNAKAPDSKKVLDALATVEKACQGIGNAGDTVTEAKQTPGGSMQRSGSVSIPSAFFKSPNNWCYVAKHRIELMTRALGNKQFFAKGYGNLEIALQDATKSLENDAWMAPWVAQLVVDPGDYKKLLKAEATDWYKQAGIPMPAEPFPALDAQLAALREQVAASAPKFKPEDGPHDARIEGMAKTGITKIYAKGKVIKATMHSKDFTIEVNALGVPLERYRSGVIFFKMEPGAKWCTERGFTYREPYAGGGKYQKPSAVEIFSSQRFISCS